MYLTTPVEGGETVFPNAAEKVVGPGWSDCALRGLAVHPKRGSALLFYRWVGLLGAQVLGCRGVRGKEVPDATSSCADALLGFGSSICSALLCYIMLGVPCCCTVQSSAALSLLDPPAVA